MRRAVVLLMALCCALSSCGGDKAASPTTSKDKAVTTETTLSPPTTHAPADPATYAVPPVIDKAYIEHVIAGIDHVQGDALRILVREKTHINEDWQKKMQATTTEDQFDIEVGLAEAHAEDDFSTLRPLPGDVRTVVTKVVTADPTCVFVEVDRNFEAQLSVEQAERSQHYVQLLPLQVEPFAAENPTPWVFALNGFDSDGAEVENPCG